MICPWVVSILTSNEIYELVHAIIPALRLTTAESIQDNWIGIASEQNLPVIDVLNHLITQEISSRRESAIRTRTKLAEFIVKKSLDDSDFEF